MRARAARRIASDGPDADIHAKLIDWYPASADYPEGFAMNLSEGVLRLRYRESWEAPEPLEPDRPYRVAVAMFPCANLFKRSHRLRLDLACGRWPGGRWPARARGRKPRT